MIPLSKDLYQWLRHIAGEERIPFDPRIRLVEEAVELNKNGGQIISSFGQREFEAMVGFLDMQGFSDAAANKSPTEVCEIVKPFLDSVITAAKKNHAFIDKSIGDEIMVVIPWYADDVVVSGLDINNTDQILMLKPYTLLADLIRDLNKQSVTAHFTAGFARGRVYLDKVGNDEYAEWTCYGNCVNAAKRLQAQTSSFPGKGSMHVHALGATIEEKSDIESELQTWQNLSKEYGVIRLHEPELRRESLRGVGEVCYLVSGIILEEAE